jgi:hypothetical protein
MNGFNGGGAGSAFMPTKKRVMSRKSNFKEIEMRDRLNSTGSQKSGMMSLDDDQDEYDEEDCAGYARGGQGGGNRGGEGEFGEEPLPGVYSSAAMVEGVLENEEAQDEDRMPCPSCNRKFAGEERLVRRKGAL